MYFLCHFTVNLIGFNTRLIDSIVIGKLNLPSVKSSQKICFPEH